MTSSMIWFVYSYLEELAVPMNGAFDVLMTKTNFKQFQWEFKEMSSVLINFCVAVQKSFHSDFKIFLKRFKTKIHVKI